MMLSKARKTISVVIGLVSSVLAFSATFAYLCKYVHTIIKLLNWQLMLLYEDQIPTCVSGCISVLCVCVCMSASRFPFCLHLAHLFEYRTGYCRV